MWTGANRISREDGKWVFGNGASGSVPMDIAWSEGQPEDRPAHHDGQTTDMDCGMIQTIGNGAADWDKGLYSAYCSFEIFQDMNISGRSLCQKMK